MLQLRQMGYRVLCRSKWFVLMTMAVTIHILHSLPSHSTVISMVYQADVLMS